MHDIKYFFSIKMIRQSGGRRERAKKISREKNKLSKKIIFQNSEEQFPRTHVDPPLLHIIPGNQLPCEARDMVSKHFFYEQTKSLLIFINKKKNYVHYGEK
jgi:hypothetical protein